MNTRTLSSYSSLKWIKLFQHRTEWQALILRFTVRQTHVEVGSNTSTVTLRVVRGESLASHCCGPGFKTGSVMWDFVVDKVALG
jgi:hypothetical protein